MLLKLGSAIHFETRTIINNIINCIGISSDSLEILDVCYILIDHGLDGPSSVFFMISCIIFLRGREG